MSSKFVLLVIAATFVALFVATPVFSSSFIVGHAATTPSSAHTHADGGLDCYGYSAKQTRAPDTKYLECADPTGINGHFTDNSWYVGHDEPNMRFISNAPGSANNFVYMFTLPANSMSSTGHPSYQSYVTFWVGLALCDNFSYPQHQCTPDSDSNTGLGNSPTDAGSAVLELQFYPPGFPSLTGCFDGPTSAVGTHWCAALNIDSLECKYLFVGCNPGCTEPVNFAFLTTNGVPVAPPSPQLQNASTFIGNQPSIFRMNPGDQILVSIHDTSQGLFTAAYDLTTGRSGFMIASAHNGFMHTIRTTCGGMPYNFHPEYSSAGTANIVPWAALQLGNSLDVEIGHYENFDVGDSHYPGGNDNSFCLPNPQGKLICAGTDFDYDGGSYRANFWPTTTMATNSKSSPVNLLPLVRGMFGPATVTPAGLAAYPTFELETDTGFTLNRQPTGTPTCNILVPNQCSVDNIGSEIPTYAGFYPYFSTLGCNVYFGNVNIAGANTFGGIAGYGQTQPVFSGSVAVWGTNGAFYPNGCR